MKILKRTLAPVLAFIMLLSCMPAMAAPENPVTVQYTAEQVGGKDGETDTTDILVKPNPFVDMKISYFHLSEGATIPQDAILERDEENETYRIPVENIKENGVEVTLTLSEESLNFEPAEGVKVTLYKAPTLCYISAIHHDGNKEENKSTEHIYFSLTAEDAQGIKVSIPEKGIEPGVLTEQGEYCLPVTFDKTLPKGEYTVSLNLEKSGYKFLPKEGSAATVTVYKATEAEKPAPKPRPKPKPAMFEKRRLVDDLSKVTVEGLIPQEAVRLDVEEKGNGLYDLNLLDKENKLVYTDELLWVEIPIPEEMEKENLRLKADGNFVTMERHGDKLRFALRFTPPGIEAHLIFLEKEGIRIESTTNAIPKGTRLTVEKLSALNYRIQLLDKKDNPLHSNGPVMLILPGDDVHGENLRIKVDGIYTTFERNGENNFAVPVEF